MTLQVIKRNITSNKTCPYPISTNITHAECDITSLEFLPNVYNLDPIMRHPHTNPNRKTLSKIADQQLSKVLKL